MLNARRAVRLGGADGVRVSKGPQNEALAAACWQENCAPRLGSLSQHYGHQKGVEPVYAFDILPTGTPELT